MKTLKVMSIVGFVMAGLSFLCISSYQYSDFNAAVGWGYIAIIYLIALSIVTLVQSGKKVVE